MACRSFLLPPARRGPSLALFCTTTRGLHGRPVATLHDGRQARSSSSSSSSSSSHQARVSQQKAVRPQPQQQSQQLSAEERENAEKQKQKERNKRARIARKAKKRAAFEREQQQENAAVKDVTQHSKEVEGGKGKRKHPQRQSQQQQHASGNKSNATTAKSPAKLREDVKQLMEAVRQKAKEMKMRKNDDANANDNDKNKRRHQQPQHAQQQQHPKTKGTERKSATANPTTKRPEPDKTTTSVLDSIKEPAEAVRLFNLMLRENMLPPNENVLYNGLPIRVLAKRIQQNQRQQPKMEKQNNETKKEEKNEEKIEDEPDEEVMALVIQYYAEKGRPERAFTMLKKMKEYDLQAGPKHSNLAMMAFLASGWPQRVADVAEYLLHLLQHDQQQVEDIKKEEEGEKGRKVVNYHTKELMACALVGSGKMEEAALLLTSLEQEKKKQRENNLERVVRKVMHDVVKMARARPAAKQIFEEWNNSNLSDLKLVFERVRTVSIND
ncbi:hypothetical protein QOT17_004026 [Balamuthia mandrillaris]